MNIAVIIPCYNAAPWIRRTLESVLSQQQPPNEVIVVDDGSTDESPAILSQFGAGIRVIRQANAGLGAARNAGAASATATWVAFLDADDLHLAGTLQEYRLLHDSFPDATVLFGDFALFDDRGVDRAHGIHHLHDLPRWAAAQSGRHFLLKRPAEILIERNGAFTPSCLVLRRDVWSRVGGFDESRAFQGAEDLDLYFRLLATEDVAFTTEVVVHKRQHPGNMSRNVLQMRGAGERALGRASDFYGRHHRELLPIVNAKAASMLAGWAADDVEHARPGARETVKRLLAHRPLSIRAWWLMARCLVTTSGGQHRY
jgi:glycosyltransferase involved in cell wall biosynthesis